MSFEIYEPTEEDRRRMLLDAEAKRLELEGRHAAAAARFTGSDPKPPTAEDVAALLRSMPISYSLPVLVESLAHILRRLDELKRTGPVDR